MIRNRQNIQKEFQAQDYILHEELENAVNVAIALGQPLLLTGEPGTGKTKLARRVAYELAKENGSSFSPQPLEFYTKTTSSARDLFYTYDAVSHFQAANLKRDDGQTKPTSEFIELQALGKAIAFSDPAAVDNSKFATNLPEKPQSSVVLIDEIDKAPRDFTNDILNEIESFSFRIKEQDNHEIKKSKEQQIVIIMTSNSEKNLPDAFLRRCVFYHIPFPTDELMLEIVSSQLGKDTLYTQATLEALIKKFNAIRKNAVRKKPATAELIAWLRILEMQSYLEKPAKEQEKIILQNLSILVKTKEDFEAVQEYLKTLG